MRLLLDGDYRLREQGKGRHSYVACRGQELLWTTSELGGRRFAAGAD